ncbi:hypothetical protein QO002_006285 [Pararhizobium capsulatum DSM 1112]|uniref:Uncharacterized protein n=1 Tax=Pararhizobium capsulatum DSM 1112 TaxID=1121113 RepID=A0ABU0C0M7_9HYPH|nr:hypothetical protein [Pararhizobium capsulatum DSM 1112]
MGAFTPSIRLRFIAWFDDIRDHLAENTMQVFRGSKVDEALDFLEHE